MFVFLFVTNHLTMFIKFRKTLAKIASFTLIAGLFLPLLNPIPAQANTGSLNVVVSPEEGRYVVKNSVTLDEVVSERSGSRSFTIPMGDYVVDFLDIPGNYNTPDDVFFTLDAGETETVTGIYSASDPFTGTLNVVVSPSNGEYEVRNSVTGDVAVSPRTGSASYSLPYNDYVVDFLDIGPSYSTPDDVFLTLDALNPDVTATGTYTFVSAGDATIVVNVVNLAGDPITGGDWELRTCTGPSQADCGTTYLTGTESVFLSSQPAGIYGLAYGTGSHAAVSLLSPTPQTVNSGETITFDLEYTENVVGPQADPAITKKLVYPTEAPAGARVTYEIDYTNFGPDPAGNVVLEDNYEEAYLSIDPATLPSGCTDDGTQIVCQLGTINPSEARTLRYEGILSSGAPVGERIENTVDIVTASSDTDMSNNHAEAVVTVSIPRPQFDPRITKSANKLNPVPLEVVEYTLDYANRGTDTVTGVSVRDDYEQAKLEIIQILDGTCSDDGDQLNCTVGDLAGGESGQIRYLAQVKASATPGTTVSNTVTVGADQDDNPANNTDTVDLTVGAPSATGDPAVLLKFADNPSPAPFEVIEYRVHFANLGLGKANNTVLRDLYSQNHVRILSNNLGCSDDGAQLTCNLGDLDGQDRGVLTYRALVLPAATPGTVIHNTAHITADENDLTANDRFLYDVTVAPSGVDADPALIQKTVNNPTPVRGETVEYSVQLVNIGQTAATNVVVVDNYPEHQLTHIELADPTHCSDDGRQITCSYPSLNFGEFAFINYRARVVETALPGDLISNKAEIVSADTNARLDNDVAHYTLRVDSPTPGADVVLFDKTASDYHLLPGETVTYTLEFGNLGSQPAMNWVIVDDYDQDNLTNIVLDRADLCTDDGDVITCNRAMLDVLDRLSISYSAEVAPADPTVDTYIENHARIDADRNDDTTNDMANETIYVPGTAGGTKATLSLTTLPVSGEIFVDGASVGIPTNPGDVFLHEVDITQPHTISFADVTGYTTPHDIYLPADVLVAGSTVEYKGNYVEDGFAATLAVTTIPVQGEILVGTTSPPSIGLYLGYPTAPGEYVNVNVDIRVLHNILFGDVAGYTKPGAIVIPAGTLEAGLTYEFTGRYIETSKAAYIVVGTEPVRGPIFLNGFPLGTQFSGYPLNATVDITEDNVLSYGDFAGYITPLDELIPANSLAVGSTDNRYFGVYRPIVANAATFEITTTPVAGEIKVDGVSLGTPANPGDILSIQVDSTQDHTISFGTVTGYTTPGDIFIPQDRITTGTTYSFTGEYVDESDSATLEVTTTPVVGEIVVNGVSRGYAPTAGTFVKVTIDSTRDQTLSFGNVAGYITPSDMTIAEADVAPGDLIQRTGVYEAGTVATLEVTTDPVRGEVFFDGVSLGTPAAPGDLLVTTFDVTTAHTITFADVTPFITPSPIVIEANSVVGGATVQHTGQYTLPPEISVTKTADKGTVQASDERISYTIRIRRNLTTTPGTITATVNDTITGRGILSGGTGGQLIYVPNTATCEGVVCEGVTSGDNNPDLTVEPIKVFLDGIGSEAVIRYTLRGNLAGVAPLGVSTVPNIVSVNYPALATPVSEQLVVTLHNPDGTGGPGPGNGGGGGPVGNGGGNVVHRGDMKLDIQKLISLDGQNFEEAGNADQGFLLPENSDVTVYNKVLLTNRGKVSAAQIELRPYTDSGRTGMRFGPIENLSGGTLRDDVILVDTVKVGETYTLTYQYRVEGTGKSSNPAVEGLELVSFGSRLPATTDGLTYLGLGGKHESHLHSGNLPLPRPGSSTASVLKIDVRSDRSAAAVGDAVNFTVLMTNVTDENLTNLFINHTYNPATYEVTSALGAVNDGRELVWERPVLAPGETLTLRFSTKIKATAPVGDIVKGLTRALVSEYADIAPFENFVRIAAGPATTAQPGRTFELAATGPGMMILLVLLSFLGYFGSEYGRDLYTRRVRRLALQEL